MKSQRPNHLTENNLWCVLQPAAWRPLATEHIALLPASGRSSTAAPWDRLVVISHPVHCCSLGLSGGHLSLLIPCTAAAHWDCLVVISHFSSRALLLLTGTRRLGVISQLSSRALLLTGTVWWSSLTSDPVHCCCCSVELSGGHLSPLNPCTAAAHWDCVVVISHL